MSTLSYGRDRLGNAAEASRLEWMVTNGIGGYAAGTVGGALTRRYHGLLTAAMKPPVGRTLLLAKLAESLEIDGQWHELDTNIWASGVTSPQGYHALESFHLEDTIPCWIWAIGDTRLEKRVWMEHGENTTYVQYRLSRARGPVTLSLKALVNHRDAHALTAHGDWSARIEPATGGVRIEAHDGATPLWLIAPGAAIRPVHDWYRGYKLPLETERGLEDVEDHLFAAEIRATLDPGESFTMLASTRHDAGLGGAGPLALATALGRRRMHEKSLIEMWKKTEPKASRNAPAWVRQLVLAADAFVVERAATGDQNGRSIIAGYPWFGDWGRDTMIALPGLALSTGRPEIARAVLATYARFVDQGMLPNYFPDHGEPPEYNTVDAALWFFQAVRAYVEATGNDGFLAEVFPVLEEIGAWYERGTRYGIAVDPEDGLVRAGAPGVQLTWMDAKVGDWVVTPREGKPVEVNALWYSALCTMVELGKRLRRPVEGYEESAARVERSFDRFWNVEGNCLYDVIDGPGGSDASVRPNQLFAVSLPHSPLASMRQRAVLDCCGRFLLTSHGLRSLSPHHPEYRGRYAGDRVRRDGAYHQGTAWPWLLPHWALAHYRVHGDREAALSVLDPLGNLIGAGAVGTLPEIADGNAPFTSRGCVAQAWSVAEALRAWHTITGSRPPARKTVARRPARRSTMRRRLVGVR